MIAISGVDIPLVEELDGGAIITVPRLLFPGAELVCDELV
jgi:hypothetical protein